MNKVSREELAEELAEEFDHTFWLLEASMRLQDAGVEVGVNPTSPAGAILIAEAVNLAAKAINSEFYDIKPQAFCAAALVEGVESFWSQDDNCFYLFADGAGEVCCHDPYGETWRLSCSLGLDRVIGGYQWSGIRRQWAAFFALVSPAARRVLDEGSLLLSAGQVNKTLIRLSENQGF